MAFAGAISKVRADQSRGIWDVDYISMADRIKARRERVTKRMDAAKRLTKMMKIQRMMGFKGEEEEELFVKVTAKKGKLNTHNIDNNGKDLVSNVQLAGKFLQGEHRTNVEKKDEEIKKILDAEEIEMQQKFDNIVKTWPAHGEKIKGDPTQLFEDILAQKELCNQILKSKNNLIKMLEDENRTVDKSYKELIEEYHTNISVISGRMEYHVHSLQNVLDNETSNLKTSYEQQKSQQFRRGESSCRVLIEGLARNSKEHMESRLALVKDQEQEMNELIINDYEELGDTRDKMELSARCVEEQIEMIQAITHLNSERLDYEIHVLNKHEEENARIKSDQKRKITVLQDTSNKLKTKVQEAEMNLEKEKAQLVEGAKYAKRQIRELEEKQKKFGARSAKTRDDMTKMMKEEAYALLDRITENDNLLENIYLKRPFRASSEEKKSANAMLSRLDSTTEESSPSERSRHSSRKMMKQKSKSKDVHKPEDENENLKHMLLTLIEKADFLVEEDLNELMAVLPDKDKLLLKVDSILGALGVREEKDIERIFKHLTVNTDMVSPPTEAEVDPTDIITIAEKRSKILKVLREYVEEPQTTEKNAQQRKALFGTFDILKTVASSIQPDREGYLWAELREAIQEFQSPERAHLKKLLTEYKDILLARADLMKRNNALRDQNKELRTLLKDFLEG